MKINITVDVPPRMEHPAVKRRTIHERVAEALNNVDSGSEHVDEDWKLLFKVKKELEKKSKLSECLQKMLDKILDTVYKYDKDETPTAEGAK